MAYAVELFFDMRTAESFRSAWAAPADLSGNPYTLDNSVHPHVALTVFEAESVGEKLTSQLARCAEKLDATVLLPVGIGSFGGQEPAVFMGFAACPFLTRVHACVQSVLDQQGLVTHEYYRAAQWVPHCTLAMNLARTRLSKTLKAAEKLATSVPWVASKIGVVQFPPTKLLWVGSLVANAQDGK